MQESIIKNTFSVEDNQIVKKSMQMSQERKENILKNINISASKASLENTLIDIFKQDMNQPESPPPLSRRKDSETFELLNSANLKINQTNQVVQSHEFNVEQAGPGERSKSPLQVESITSEVDRKQQIERDEEVAQAVDMNGEMDERKG